MRGNKNKRRIDFFTHLKIGLAYLKIGPGEA